MRIGGSCRLSITCFLSIINIGESNMKITKQDIGRRVLINGKIGTEDFVNEPGKLVYIDSFDNVAPYAIEFDNSRDCFHVCHRYAKSKHGWWVDKKHITFTEESNEPVKTYSGLDIHLPEVQALVGQSVLYSDDTIDWKGPFTLKAIKFINIRKFISETEWENSFIYIKTISNLSILNCPFCQSKNVFVRIPIADGEEYSVICNNCKAHGPSKQTNEEAIKAWNRKDDDFVMPVPVVARYKATLTKEDKEVK